jgi:hypothetical protein
MAAVVLHTRVLRYSLPPVLASESAWSAQHHSCCTCQVVRAVAEILAVRPGALSSEPIQRRLVELVESSVLESRMPATAACTSYQSPAPGVDAEPEGVGGMGMGPFSVPSVPSICTPNGDGCAVGVARAVLSPGSSASTGTSASSSVSAKKIVRFRGEADGVSVQLFDETEPASQCSPNEPSELDGSWCKAAGPAASSSLRPSCASVHPPERRRSEPLVTHVRWNADIVRWETLVERAQRLEHLGSFQECEDAERMAQWYRSQISDNSAARCDGDAESARAACAEVNAALTVEGDLCSVQVGASTVDSQPLSTAETVVSGLIGTQCGNERATIGKGPPELEFVAADHQLAVHCELHESVQVGDRADVAALSSSDKRVRNGRSALMSVGRAERPVSSKGAHGLEGMKEIGATAIDRGRERLDSAQMRASTTPATCMGALPALNHSVCSQAAHEQSDVPPLDVAGVVQPHTWPSGACLDRSDAEADADRRTDKGTSTDCCEHASQATQTVWQRLRARLDERAGWVVPKPTPLSCLRHRTPSPHRDRVRSSLVRIRFGSIRERKRSLVPPAVA